MAVQRVVARTAESRMFEFPEGRCPSWNPVVGCLHMCRYRCWARMHARRQIWRCIYCGSFTPHLHVERLKMGRIPRSKVPVFVVDMGDLWGWWVPDKWILEVLKACRQREENTYLFLTKNPARFHQFLDKIPENSILGATIETNRSIKVSEAPPPERRFEAMKNLPWKRKFISIEPVLDFDPDVFASWIREIKPEVVFIGYDNYPFKGNHLPEPPLWKVVKLIEEVSRHAAVYTKTLREPVSSP